MRFLKYFFVTCMAVFTLIVGGNAVGYYFPPTYEAATVLPGTSVQIIMQIEPMHPYLAEYRRTLVLRQTGKADKRIEMSPDAGGYLRTQVYRLPNGNFLVRGYFDAVGIDIVQQTLVAMDNGPSLSGVHVGAFDHTKSHEFRYVDASQSPEQSLAAQGG